MTTLKFLLLFCIDIYFSISGLLLLKTTGEVFAVSSSLVVIWITIWSIFKIVFYIRAKREGSTSFNFLRYYFDYAYKVSNSIIKDERMIKITSSAKSRLVFPTISLIMGIFALSLIYFKSTENITLTRVLFLNNSLLFFLAPIILAPVLNLKNLHTLSDFCKMVYISFAVKLIYLFLYVLTFLSPVPWLFLIYLNYIQASVVRKHNSLILKD